MSIVSTGRQRVHTLAPPLGLAKAGANEDRRALACPVNADVRVDGSGRFWSMWQIRKSPELPECGGSSGEADPWCRNLPINFTTLVTSRRLVRS
jgi:hypothetical protein